MSELLKKQIDGVMKKISGSHASPRKVCEENERKKKNDSPTRMIIFETKDLKSQYSTMVGWISVNFGLLIPNGLKVLVL